MKRIFLIVGLTVFVLAGCGKVEEVDLNENMTEEVTEMEEVIGGSDVEEMTEVPEQIGDWKLVWHDEFDDEQINMDNWSYDVPTNGRWNNEIQSYTPNNAFIEDGSLILEAREEEIIEASGETYDYSSAKLISQGKQKFTYGRVEIRAKMPTGQGIWPALWMMPEDEQNYGTWPVCGEIDIMELLGNKPEEIHGTLHFGEPHQQLQGTVNLGSEGNFTDDYHVYAIEWQPGKIDWYLDGELFHTASDWFSKKTDSPEDYAYPAPFDQDFYIIMNISVGGNWPGNPDDTTVFPQQMAVDYVRVYEKETYEVFEKPEAEVIEARDPMEDGNYIYNGDFKQSDFELTSVQEGDTVDEWTFYQGETASSAYIVSDGVMHVQIENGGDTDYAVQFYQTPVRLKEGTTYAVSFDVKADAEREVKIKVGGDGDRGWIDYANEPPVEVSTEWETKTFWFSMSEEEDLKGRLEFNLGLSDIDVYITNVELVEISER